MSARKKYGKPKHHDWGEFTEWPNGRILAFDQALAKTGWAFVSFSEGCRPVLISSGTITTEPSEDGLSGFEDSLNRGDYLFETFSSLITSMQFEAVAHEMPAMMGGTKSSKAEAPIVAAMALRSAFRAEAPRVPCMIVQAQRAKATVAGRPHAEKAEMRSAVMSVLGYEAWRTNEHVTDAVAIAVTAALDGVLEEES